MYNHKETYLIKLVNGEEIVKTFYKNVGLQTLKEFILCNEIPVYSYKLI